jgi:two-component system OmpR family response regulator
VPAAAATATRGADAAMRILLVEDEPALRAQLGDALRTAGYVVDEAADGRDAQALGDAEPFDAVVLDLGLPGVDGLTVLRRWRDAARTMPVLILTARDGWSEKVAGIDAGADDYLTKPFHIEELLARLRALIRRAAGLASAVLACGTVTLDTRSGRVAVDGRPVTLTAHEYKVLEYLMHRPGTVVSRTELTEHIYAQDFDRDSNTIEVFVGRLRRKLPSDAIETVRGLGYRLAPAP